MASLQNKDIWKHVVTVDPISLARKGKIKKINQRVNDEDFVRRIYLDITGRIPTYEQMLQFRKSKLINKREALIDELLNSPGYVTNFTFFWQDLLRNKGTYGVRQDPGNIFMGYTRYMERFLYENKPCDKIVYELVHSNWSSSGKPCCRLLLTRY